MPLSTSQISSIDSSVAALLASGEPLVPGLRSQYPQITFVRCALEDMDGSPYRTGNGYQLYLLNRSEVCISITDSPEHADGVVVAV